MSVCALQSALLTVLLFLISSSVSFAQDTSFKRWRYTKDGKVAVFTAKFVGLSEENAVFSNRKNKLAKIPLEALARESLEDLVVMHAPAVTTDGQQLNENDHTPKEQADTSKGEPRWKRKLSSDLDKAMVRIEKAKKDYFKGSEKWNENKLNQAKEKFDAVIRSELIECIIPCEIVSVATPENPRRSNSKYKTTLLVKGIGEFTQDLKQRQSSARHRSYRTIADANINIGSKVKLKCQIGFSKSDPYNMQAVSGSFGVSQYQRQTELSIDAKFSPLLGTSVSRGGQTYYLIYRGFHVE